MATAKDIFKKIDTDVKGLTTEVNALADRTRQLRSKVSVQEKDLRSQLLGTVNLLMPVTSVRFLESRRAYRILIQETLDDAAQKAEAASREVQVAEDSNRMETETFDLAVQQIEAQFALRLKPIQEARQSAEAKLNALAVAREPEDRVFRSEKFRLENRFFLHLIHANRYGSDGYEPGHFIFDLAGRVASTLKRTEWYNNAIQGYNLAKATLAKRDEAIETATAARDAISNQIEDVQQEASGAIELKRGPGYGTSLTLRVAQQVHSTEAKRLRLCQDPVAAFDQGQDQLMEDGINELQARLAKDGPSKFLQRSELSDDDIRNAISTCYDSMIALQQDAAELPELEQEYHKAKIALEKLTKQRDKMKSKGWSSSSKSISDTKVNDYMNGSSTFDLTDVMTIVLISDLISDNSSVFDTSVTDNSSSWTDTSSSSFDF